MRLAGRLGKLEPPIRERWLARWNGYMDRVLGQLPLAAIDRLAEGVPTVDDEQVLSYARKVFTELGLDYDTWTAWADEVSAAYPENYQGQGTPYHLTPERIPKPPANASEALEVAQGWTYPDTLEGRSRTFVALYLAQAVELSEHKKHS